MSEKTVRCQSLTYMNHVIVACFEAFMKYTHPEQTAHLHSTLANDCICHDACTDVALSEHAHYAYVFITAGGLSKGI